MSKTTWLVSIAVILIIGGVATISYIQSIHKVNKEHVVIPIDSTTPTKPIVVIPYGRTILTMGQTATFSDISIKFLRVTEDSRCPQGVQCIWAGTFRTEIQIVSKKGASTQVIELRKSILTETEIISLLAVAPYPNKGGAILASDYSVTFEVTKRLTSIPPSKPIVQGACYVGGCSSELCSDKPGTVSNCIYRSEFACYKETKCERQVSGQCGWTQTDAFKVCLTNSVSLQ
jgi:hypothetical protein